MTGNRRGAGTTAAVFVELVGRKGKSSQVLAPGNYERDSVVTVVVRTPESLGEIRSVRVGHDGEGNEGTGWYLEQVELEYALEDGEACPAAGPWPSSSSSNAAAAAATPTAASLRFPVRRWLGTSDFGRGSFPLDVTLKVGILDSMSDPEPRFFLRHEQQAGAGEAGAGPGMGAGTGAGAGAAALPRSSKPLFVETGVAAFPHPDKVRNGDKAVVRHDVGRAGEDAYSIAVVEHPEIPPSVVRAAQLGGPLLPTTLTISVADGVYSWRKQGIDSGEWSRFLTTKVRHLTQHHVRDSSDVLLAPVAGGGGEAHAVGASYRPWADRYLSLKLQPPTIPLRHPLDVLELTERALHETDLKGSSTACIASIHGLDRVMYVACLGDSGLLLFRPGHGIVFRTPEQEHQFGFPYQLGHHELSDKATDALCYDLDLHEGDVVVLASDGLFDNVSEKEIEGVLAKYAKAAGRPATDRRGASKCANELASLAWQYSVGTKDTPYSKTAAEEYNLVWHGGKKDDVTVVVALCS
jgi:protein phosphatase PTC7